VKILYLIIVYFCSTLAQSGEVKVYLSGIQLSSTKTPVIYLGSERQVSLSFTNIDTVKSIIVSDPIAQKCIDYSSNIFNVEFFRPLNQFDTRINLPCFSEYSKADYAYKVSFNVEIVTSEKTYRKIYKILAHPEAHAILYSCEDRKRAFSWLNCN